MNLLSFYYIMAKELIMRCYFVKKRDFCRFSVFGNKRFGLQSIAFLLCLFLLAVSLPLGAVCISDTQTELSGNSLTAVYAFGGYTVSLKNAVYLEDGRDDGKMLTDRIYTSVTLRNKNEPITGWLMAKSKDGKKGFSVSVDIDLGYTVKNLCRFYLRAFRNAELKAEMPDKITFYASEDGDEFFKIGAASTLSDISAASCAAIYKITLENAVKARYIRAVIESDSTDMAVWINEVGAAANADIEYANTLSNGKIRDTNGVIYSVKDGFASVVGYDASARRSVATASETDFDSDENAYVLGIGTGNAVKVIPDFIGDDRINYSGVPNNIKYIIIHNTGTTEEETDAARYNRRVHTTAGETSWHYTVDENLIYHSLADSAVGWHAGTGLNYESIGIEICVNGAPTRSSGEAVFKGSAYEKWVEERFDKSLRNTAVLVAELLTRYGLTKDAVIQHYDATEKNCPQWLRYKDGKYVYDGTLWERFMGYVGDYYDMINTDSVNGTVVLKTDITIPDYISVDGKVFPVTEIAPSAFADIDAPIRSVTVGTEVRKIAPNCFGGNPELENVFIKSGNGYFFVGDDSTVYSTDGSAVYDPSAFESTPPEPKKSSRLDIREIDGKYYVFCKEERYTLAELADDYGAYEFSANRMDGSLVGLDQVPGTGTTLCFNSSRLYLVILGDINGDAIIDTYDYILIKRTCLKTYSPLKRQQQAMILRSSNSISVYDYIILKRHVMGTYNIFDKM